MGRRLQILRNRMQTFNTDIEQIRTLAWTLAMASAENRLDVPGEYVWAFPKDISMDEVRARSRSIFSSGNSIKHNFHIFSIVYLLGQDLLASKAIFSN